MHLCHYIAVQEFDIKINLYVVLINALCLQAAVNFLSQQEQLS